MLLRDHPPRRQLHVVPQRRRQVARQRQRRAPRAFAPASAALRSATAYALGSLLGVLAAPQPLLSTSVKLFGPPLDHTPRLASEVPTNSKHAGGILLEPAAAAWQVQICFFCAQRIITMTAAFARGPPGATGKSPFALWQELSPRAGHPERASSLPRPRIPRRATTATPKTAICEGAQPAYAPAGR